MPDKSAHGNLGKQEIDPAVAWVHATPIQTGDFDGGARPDAHFAVFSTTPIH